MLTGNGHQVAPKTVLKCMRQAGLHCHVRRRRRCMAWSGAVGQVAPNVLECGFTAGAPNRKWVSDVTEFRIGDRKLCLSPMPDLFDHQVIAYGLSASPSLMPGNAALDHALRDQPVEPGLIVHTDQGFRYQHVSWRWRLADVGAIQSISRRGNC